MITKLLKWCGLCALLAMVSASRAQGVDLGVYGGAQTGSAETKSGSALLGVLSFPSGDLYAVDVRVGTFSSDSDINTLSKSTIHTTTLELVPRLRFRNNSVTFSLGAGPAIFFMKEDLDPAVATAANAFGLTSYREELDNTFGGVFGGAVDIALNDSIILSGDLSYLYYKPEVTASGSNGFATASITERVDLSTVRFLIGVKVRFGESSHLRQGVLSSAPVLPSEAAPAAQPQVAPPLSSTQKTREFIVMSYPQLLKDLAKGEGPYLASLLDLLKIASSERPEAKRKIRALSEAYTSIPEFADHVLELCADHRTVPAAVAPAPAAVPPGPAKVVPTKPEENPAAL